MLQTRQPRARRRMPPPQGPARASSPAGSTVPFDFAARFELRGEPGRLVQDVISIGPDADFTAVAISYAFEEDRRRLVGLQPPRVDGGRATSINANVALGQITLDEIPPQALVDGVRVNPKLERLVFDQVDETTGTAAREALRLSGEPITAGHLTPGEVATERVLQRLKRIEPISFLFSLVDTTTGREMQDQPVHNLASLGNPDGERPFRLLAKPVTFTASSTLRVQVVERTPGIRGTLFIVLIGYKALRSCRPVPAPAPGSRVVPFDYVARLEMKGIPGRREETEVPICVDGGFTATAIGYGLEVTDTNVTLSDRAGANGLVNLRAVTLGQLPLSALVDGFRIRPDCVRFAFGSDATLNSAVPAALADRIFERANQSDATMFRYRMFDDGRGIELQNVAIHNVAGLGTASGDRPFKQLPAPLRFLPRSSLRISIEEVLGRGRLYIVLQGYRHVTDRRRTR